MGTPKTTTYANVINFRVTNSEFVLEFGAFFPENPNQGPPSDYTPEVRVVLPATALPGIVSTLSQLLQQREQQENASRKVPGFQSAKSEKKDTH
jgi:hypothetical protein